MPATLRKEILEGKELNLASLLIAVNEVPENKSYVCREVLVILKAKDPWLNRKLTVAEFVLAFGTYRDVICSVSH